MKSVCTIPLLAIAVSAQYQITDLLGKQGSTGASQLAPTLAPSGPTPGTVSANPANPMATLLSGLANPLAASRTAGKGPFTSAALSQTSTEVVSGMVEAFMHKVKLEPGERNCLENNMRVVSGDVMGTVGDVVTTVKTLMNGNGTVQKKQTGSLVSAGMDSAMKITSLITSSIQLVKNCVHGDAVELMDQTAKNLLNGTYLANRFIVNGVDIAHYLSDSVVAFDARNYHKFGYDIGTGLRKMLLSKSQNATRLPEGMPQEEIIQECTDGLMKGFFASGSAIEITDAAHPDVDIVIDLHTCIAGNSAFFKELWLAAWNLVAQLALNGDQHEFGSAHQQRGQPKWEGELMVAMMQFPTALSNCGMDQSIQAMFSEAINSLSQVNAKIQFPNGNFKSNAAADEMAKAVEAWTTWNFEAFGYQLGKFLRQIVLIAFPQKYAVDDTGRLRLYSQHKTEGESVPTTVAVIAGASFAMILGFAALRLRVSCAQAPDRAAFRSDVEEAFDSEHESSVE
jgi:hypothetical protein